MTAELIAQGCQHAGGIIFLVAAGEAHLQRQGNDRGGDVQVNGFKDCPAAFTRVCDPGFDVFQFGVFVEGVGGKVEQPRADDAAVLPDV